jgi:ATP-dependent exoDNAse (exonuclease V) alpha subunit
MLRTHIARLLEENFDYEPTGSQRDLILKLSLFLTDSSPKNIFLLKGYAGTGKTSIISSLVKTLDEFRIQYVLMAPTGRASKVLSTYTQRPAFTIHKKIYIQKSSREGMGIFVLERNMHSNTYFIIDEASMINNQAQEVEIFGTGRLLDDLVEYVYNGKNNKLILIGDTAQLPPVGLNISPALDPEVLRKYDMKVTESCLKDVIRQSMGSGILHNATAIRNLLDNNNIGMPSVRTRGFQDVIPISGQDLLEELERSYYDYGRDRTIVVTRSNKRANKYNQGIRNQILNRESEICKGDFVMIVRNNYFWLDENQATDFIANGDIAEVVRINNIEEQYGFRFADAMLSFPDYGNMKVSCKVMLDTLMIETAALDHNKSIELYHHIIEDYPEIKSKRKQYEAVRDHQYFNALQIKFAYAVTCHKAQGGQWDSVFIDQGYITEDMINIEYLRWLYTAFTRAIKKLYMVNFNPKYFED